MELINRLTIAALLNVVSASNSEQPPGPHPVVPTCPGTPSVPRNPVRQPVFGDLAQWANAWATRAGGERRAVSRAAREPTGGMRWRFRPCSWRIPGTADSAES